jgi:hypothetical protein
VGNPANVPILIAKAPRRLTAAIGIGLDRAMANDSNERYVEALGLAALDLWSELPHDVQQVLFERAVVHGHKSERDENLREQLAQFLHAHHERTAKGKAGPRSAG